MGHQSTKHTGIRRKYMSFSTSSILRGSFTSTGAPFTLSVPGVTNFGLYNISNISANAPNAVWWANWNFGMPQGSALVGTSNGGPTDVLETFSAANGVALVDSSVQALGPAQAATAVSQAAAAVVTSAGHTFLNGDESTRATPLAAENVSRT